MGVDAMGDEASAWRRYGGDGDENVKEGRQKQESRREAQAGGKVG